MTNPERRGDSVAYVATRRRVAHGAGVVAGRHRNVSAVASSTVGTSAGVSRRSWGVGARCQSTAIGASISARALPEHSTALPEPDAASGAPLPEPCAAAAQHRCWSRRTASHRGGSAA
jgi:hypothetical protein